MGIFSKLFPKKEEEYVEIDISKDIGRKAKISIRPYVLREFNDVNKILEVMREGYTIAIIDIKPLKSKDIIELKRAVAKLKKTVDAMEGEIAGFGENIIIATPSFVRIYRGEEIAKVEKVERI